jgi:hypothetical protein
MRNARLNDYLPFECVHEYRIYEDGRVHNETNGKWLRGTSVTKNNRYVKIHIGADEVSKFIPLHRLVAQIFVPNPNNLPQVNHIDGNRYNNSASNLEWCTAKHNINHCWANGMHMVQHGEINGWSRLTNDEAKWIYSFKDSGLTPTQFKNRYKFYKVSRTVISSIWKGNSWARVTGHIKSK